MSRRATIYREPIVITGIGAMASVGDDRESVWQAVQRGESGVRHMVGVTGIPDGEMIGATIDVPTPRKKLKQLILVERTAKEALDDAGVNLNDVDRQRFGCSVSAVMGDWMFQGRGHGFYDQSYECEPWYGQWLPNTPVADIGGKLGLNGPRLAYSTACASGLIGVLSAVRAIRDGQCDIALAGSGDAIDGLMASGFRKMRALASHSDPREACRPFDKHRSGFVLGEGAAMFVVERLTHALARGAKIYAEIRCGKVFSEAHHVTGLESNPDALIHLMNTTLQAAGWSVEDVGHINTHGTGTLQNDLAEMRAIRGVFGDQAEGVCVTANKSSIGHLINAAGSMELALTVLALRDGFAPPTLNLTDPDAECTFDCTPLVGRSNRFQNALKISVAFGGHLVAMALSRWNDAASGFGYPDEQRRAA